MSVSPTLVSLMCGGAHFHREHDVGGHIERARLHRRRRGARGAPRAGHEGAHRTHARAALLDGEDAHEFQPEAGCQTSPLGAASAAPSWECVARVVTPTSICTLSGFAVTRASPVTRIDDSVGAGVSARAGTEPAAPTSSAATRHGVFPTQVERILIFYACCVRQFIVWTGGRACARPGA